MGTKREEYRLRGGDILEIREFHDGRYGAPGQRREKKKKPTEEQMRQANEREKIRRCQLRMMTYFHEGDCLATLTYRQDKRPPNMNEALKDFQKAIRKVRKEYQKRGYEVFWIRNIERGTKGAWHIHIVLNEIGDTASILQQVWGKGGVWSCEIKNSQFYSEDFYQLASYLTKSEHRIEHKSNGDAAKPRLKETSYNTSRNMPLPEPKIQKLVRWQEEAKTRKGYYIAKIYEGYNPVTGYKYRQYTMIRLERRRTDYDGDRRLRRDKHKRTAGKKA